jgi:hypothetical protein
MVDDLLRINKTDCIKAASDDYDGATHFGTFAYRGYKSCQHIAAGV